MKRRINYEPIVIVLTFLMITIFAVIFSNQLLKAAVNNRYYNNFYGGDCRKIKIEASEPKFTLDVTDLGDNYVIYDHLSSDNDSISYVDDQVRAVYGKGAYPKPPMLEGEYFTEEQLLSSEPLCVIGSEAKERTATLADDGNWYYPYRGINYKVIGIAGLDKVSDIDIAVFLNWGGYFSTTDLYAGTYYIDANSDTVIDSVFLEFVAELDSLLEQADSKRAPFSYMQLVHKSMIRQFDSTVQLIYIICIIILMVNLLLVSLYYISKNEYIFAVKKLCGFSLTEILFDVTGKYILLGAGGFALGLGALLIIKNFFTESISNDFIYFTELSASSLAVSFVFIVALAFIVSIIPVSRVYAIDTGEKLK